MFNVATWLMTEEDSSCRLIISGVVTDVGVSVISGVGVVTRIGIDLGFIICVIVISLFGISRLCDKTMLDACLSKTLCHRKRVH